MTLTTEIDTFFQRYLAAWNARDFDAIVKCYSEPCTFVFPDVTVTAADHAALRALLQKVFVTLEADDFSHTEIASVTARPCGETLAVVDATGVKRLRRDGSILEIIDAHYTTRKSEDAWVFVTALVCAPGWQGT